MYADVQGYSLLDVGHFFGYNLCISQLEILQESFFRGTLWGPWKFFMNFLQTLPVTAAFEE